MAAFQQNGLRRMVFEIESSSYCPSGLAPRWTWWIKGLEGSKLYSVLGTNEQGRGLYVYRYDGDHYPARDELIEASRFLILTASRSDAQEQLAHAVKQLGWTLQHKV